MNNRFLQRYFAQGVIKKIILSIIGLHIAVLLAGEVKFTHLFQDEALSSITSIIQDDKGFMWIGTLNGVYKYNGVDLIHYFHKHRDPNSLSDDHVLKIYQDSRGDIWIATINGLNKYNFKKDNFKKYFHDSSDKYSLPVNTVTDILEDSEGNLWFAAHQLVLYEPEEEQFIGMVGSETEGQHVDGVHFMFEDMNDNFWIVANHHIYIFDQLSQHFFTHFSGREFLQRNPQWNFRNNMVQDKQGSFYIPVNYVGLLKFEFDGEVKNPEIIDFELANNQRLSDHSLTTLHADIKNRIWLGSENGGLTRYNPETGRAYSFMYNPTNDQSIGENSIWSVFEDREGRLWFGHHTRGVSVIDPYFYKFNYLGPGKSKRSLPASNVSSMLIGHQGKLWIGTDGGGLTMIDREKDVVKKYRYNPDDPYSLSKDAVLSLAQDVDGNIWVGTWDGGVNKLDVATGRFTRFNSANSKLTNNNVFDIVDDQLGNMYFATYGGGLFVYNIDKAEWTQFSHDDSDENSIIDDRIFSLHFDNDSNLWIGTQRSGFDKMETDRSGVPVFKHYQTSPGKEGGLSTNNINTLAEDDRGLLWIGTQEGLNRFDPEMEKFKVYRYEDGLPSNIISGIVKDDSGYLWVSSFNGLSRFDPRTEVFENYNKEDGLQGNQFNKNSVFKDDSGNLYFGGTKGLSYFHPDSIAGNPYPPEIVFTGFKLFNKEVAIEQGGVLENHISETSSLTLDHKQSVFTIEFAALNFTRPSKNQYAYKMEGLEEEWNYVGSQRNATYTSLNPGEYIFRVKASNNDGVWNEQGIALPIVITPPYWKTLWFRFLMVLLTGSVLLFFYYRRVAYLDRQKALLKRMVTERTIELSHSMEKLQSSYEEISQQKEELDTQNETLAIANNLLEEQKDRITKQNVELDNHRDHLEKMVEERTREIAVALQKAEESDKLKSSFLANMSHEIRTPMNGIIGFTELLEGEFEDEKYRKEYLEIIRSNGQHLVNLISDILDFSQIETGQLQIVKSTINVKPLLDEIFKLFKEELRKKKGDDVKLIMKVEFPDGDELFTDEMRLRQVLYNLISNAVKFTDEGSITIGCKKGEYGYLFFVKDTGIGIPDEKKKLVFERFQQVLSTNMKKQTGTGLGLSISRELVYLLGGRLWVSTKVGKGSTFFVKIPAYYK